MSDQCKERNREHEHEHEHEHYLAHHFTLIVLVHNLTFTFHASALVFIGATCQHLCELSLAFCRYDVNILFQNVILGDSIYLLDRISGVTDVGLESIAQGCMNLQSLNMRYCRRITDKGHFYILELVFRCFLRCYTNQQVSRQLAGFMS